MPAYIPAVLPVAPDSYKRRILLAVTGLSPQIVTETIYALAVKRESAWIPTEIQILSTVRGAENARLNLLSEKPGWFRRLCADYALPKIAFDEGSIHVMRSASGTPLEDIRDDEDNRAAADFLTEHVRKLTADDQASLHVSIAGGRKSMGFFLGYALSLFGRPQDRLSHVLVSSPFESHHDFYYPSPVTRVLQTPKQTLDAKNATVWLGDIPFVRMREGLPEGLLTGESRFPELVLAAQRSLAAPSLVIDLTEHGATIRAGSVDVEMAPADAAFYLLLVQAAVEGRTLRWTDADLAPAYLREYARFARDSVRYDEAAKRLADKNTLLDNWFEERKAKCNAALRRVLGKASARAYEIERFGAKGASRSGLGLPAEAIRIVEAEDSHRIPASLPSSQSRDRTR